MTSNLHRRHWLLAAAATPLLGTLPAAAAEPAALPAELFFSDPEITAAQLNPSGTRLAMRVGGKGGKRRLVVLDLATMKLTPLPGAERTHTDAFRWVSDERLVFQLGIEPEADIWTPRLFAVDADGRGLKSLADGWLGLVQQGEQPDAQVLVTRVEDVSEGAGFLRLSRVHTRSAAERDLDLPPWTVNYLLDAGGEPVAAVTARGDRAQLRWRDGKAWRQVREFDRYFGEGYELVGSGADGRVFVTARKGHDKAALYTLDPATGALSDKPLLALAQFDIAPELIQHDSRLLGLRVLADAEATVWLDDAAKALQAEVDAQLPATNNQLSLPRRGSSPWVVVRAFSDRQPEQFYLFNREGGRLLMAGRSRPAVNPQQMAAMDFITYPARDGRAIPAYITRPRQADPKQPAPLVVMVHGGPFTRGGRWQWDAEVQFLASRGYAVLQPEFRGSTGFGDAHFQAGLKQWGLAMQDDLADGVSWAVGEGIADARRVALVGGSYGGYAAMMGLVRHPEVYRCAVNYVGVTDLDLLYSANWSDVPGVFRTHGLSKILGDRKADAERLKATSPLHQAARIKKPVLMAYGRYDQRVPIEHGERMRDALRAHNPHVEWVLYDKEGHGWYRLETRLDFWGRTERFLARHLATP